MQKIQVLIGSLFVDVNRSIEDLSAGFLTHNILFQATPDPDGILNKNKLRTQGLASQLTTINTAIGSGQAQQQVGRSLTEADQGLAITRLSGTFAALGPTIDYVVADSPERARLLKLLFPQGMEPFNRANLKTLPDQLLTFLDLVQDPESKVPDIIITRSVADLTPFATTRNAQLGQMQDTSRARAKRQLLLSQLEEQLTRNLHCLCVLFEENRSEVATYFEARYFETQPVSHPGRHSGTVAAHRTNQVLTLPEGPGRYTRLRLTVAEERPLTFYRAPDTKAPAPPEVLTVTHATPLTLPLADVPGTGPLLVVCNAGAYVGHYVAELLGPEG